MATVRYFTVQKINLAEVRISNTCRQTLFENPKLNNTLLFNLGPALCTDTGIVSGRQMKRFGGGTAYTDTSYMPDYTEIGQLISKL
jgi:hypothetical protein